MSRPYRKIKEGDTFGRLVVEKRCPEKRKWRCRCTCGHVTYVNPYSLNTGETRSCGCLRADVARQRSIRHGQSTHRLYDVWTEMKKRCNRPSSKSFVNYGHRGIQVCDEWQHFGPFFAWASENGYKSGLVIDRKDNNGPYSPDNCHWTTMSVNCNNKRNNVRMSAFGELKTLTQWARDVRCVVPVNVVRQRVQKLRWPLESAILTPTWSKPNRHRYPKEVTL